MKQASALIATLAVGASAASAPEAPKFDWQSIAASKDLEYHDCYDGFKCARLIVPRDWKNETDPNTVTLAIAKLPAAVPDNDASFAGTIFSNPGGPGGSGVSFLLRGGKPLQQTVDKPGKKHYEILSWDPRGIGNTEPVVDCFDGNNLARDAEGYTEFSLPSISSGPSALNFLLAKYKARGGHCAKVMKEVLPYVNTPSVARDMVEMVDKIHELREREAGKKKPDEKDDEEDDDDRLELRRVKADKTPRLQYMGFSYGSVLGNYFAALFPERVGRVMVDGVVNTDDYAAGPGWLTATHDSDAMVDLYFKGCFEAGSATCKLYRDGDKHARDIQKRVIDWIDNLDEEPLTTVKPDGTTIVLTAEQIRSVFFSKLYNTQTTAIPVAEMIDAAMHGNATALINELTGPLQPLLNDCSINGTEPSLEIGDAYLAISCSDGDSHADEPVSYWRKYAKAQQKQSKLVGTGMAGARMGCAASILRPSWEFKGPFTSPKASEDPNHPEKGRPAAPLLFVSNRWDPVTPLVSARHMYKQHPGAGLIVQESMGHCVTAKPGVSECTKKIVADFFDTGAVPHGEHVCEGSGTPWDAVSKMSVEEEEYGKFLVERRRRAHLYGI